MIRFKPKIVVQIPILAARCWNKITSRFRKRIYFKNSAQYWEDRYASGRTSGAGSYGRLARFKAGIINGFIIEEKIHSVIEWGCGDGAQLSLANYPSYIGFDVSRSSVDICKRKFLRKGNYSFFHVSEYANQTAELVLSLDVIYHLIEDDVYEDYMRKLFTSASRFVIIYAYNFNKMYQSKHERGREFLSWIARNQSEWRLIRRIDNKYPYDSENPEQTSQSDFFIFVRKSGKEHN